VTRFNTIEALQPEPHRSPEHLSVYGILLSTCAYTAAVDGDRDTTRSLTAEAVEAATRLGSDANHRSTALGPTGVGLCRNSVARALGDYGTAIDVAKQIDPASIPLAERRARYWSDVAHAFHEPSWHARLPGNALFVLGLLSTYLVGLTVVVTGVTLSSWPLVAAGAAVTAIYPVKAVIDLVRKKRSS